MDSHETGAEAIDAGVNYYLNGHHAKFTLEYHSIQNQLSNGTSDISQLRLQMHILIIILLFFYI